ncbi:MAG TPA: VTT domain-containing protein [Planctomycetota bacterium]|nr:VTT domain-containing protein [Planctomycetota bacterium]
MKRYLVVFVFMIVLLTLMFLAAQALQIPLINDPSELMRQGKWQAALIGIGLLMSDTFLPVPSSIVMIAHGWAFGILLGTCASLVGTMGGAAVGFFIARKSNKLLSRFISDDERAQADAVLKKYGALAIIVSRPIPLLAEAIILIAGTSSMSWRMMLLAAFAGNLPASLIYAIAGATAKTIDNWALMFGLVIAVCGVFWFLGKALQKTGVLEP